MTKKTPRGDASPAALPPELSPTLHARTWLLDDGWSRVAPGFFLRLGERPRPARIN